ncbi:hypothetical protein AAMO2058_000689000 [Amorphochlora amoebiformis]
MPSPLGFRNTNPPKSSSPLLISPQPRHGMSVLAERGLNLGKIIRFGSLLLGICVVLAVFLGGGGVEEGRKAYNLGAGVSCSPINRYFTGCGGTGLGERGQRKRSMALNIKNFRENLSPYAQKKKSGKKRVIGDQDKTNPDDKVEKRVLVEDEDYSILIRMKRGVRQVADLVGATIGPKGRNVVLGVEPGKYQPGIVNDGITIAERVKLDDAIENLGAQMLLEAGANVNEESGDGTSTAILLAATMIQQGLRVITAGVNPRRITEGMELAEKKALQYIRELTKNATDTDLRRIAYTSSGDDEEASELLIKAFDDVGRNGVVKIGKSRTSVSSTRIIEGWQYKRGYIREELTNAQENTKWIAKNCHLLLINDPIMKPQDLIKPLKWAQEGNHQLLIMAEDYGQSVIQGLIMAKLKGNMDICAIRAPGMTAYNAENLGDIALLSNGTVIDELAGTTLNSFTPDMLGQVKAVEVGRSMTTLFGDFNNREPLEQRAWEVKLDIENLRFRQQNKGDSDRAIEDALQDLVERQGRLTSGIAVLEVGASSEVELKNRMLRVEDALCATRSAIRMGVVPGGGAALVSLSRWLTEHAKTIEDDEIRTGYKIIAKSLLTPLRQIANNAGISGDYVIQRVKDIQDEKGTDYGWDANTDTLLNLRDQGIIDPTRSIISAIENAASVARAFLTIKGVVRDRVRVKAGL